MNSFIIRLNVRCGAAAVAAPEALHFPSLYHFFTVVFSFVRTNFVARSIFIYCPCIIIIIKKLETWWTWITKIFFEFMYLKALIPLTHSQWNGTDSFRLLNFFPHAKIHFSLLNYFIMSFFMFYLLTWDSCRIDDGKQGELN